MKFRVTFLLVATALFLWTPETRSQAQPQWWTLPNAPRTTSRYDDVFFVNPQVGWVIHGGGQIYKTANGGATWKLQNTIATGGLRSIGFANPAKGWLGSLRNLFFMTTDSGKTWNQVQNIPDPKPQGICGISVVNENVVYAAGFYDGAPRVIKTTDGGQSWQTFDLSAHVRALVDCYFFSADSGFVVGATGVSFESQRVRILFTADGGKNWSVRLTGTRPSELCWKISFPTKRAGYVSIEAFNPGATYFLKTTNGGVTWEEKVLSNTLRDVQGIGFINEKWGWEGGNFSPTYETTDGGETWRQASFGFNVNRFRFLNDTLAYAVGQTVYKFSITAPTVGVKENPIPPPAGITLFQNYPNPFWSGATSPAMGGGNPSTKIRYSLDRDDEIAILTVYDVTGKKIKTLFAGGRPPGEYVADWDGTDDANETVAAGVYFSRLQTGGAVQSKKMLLLR